MVLPDPPRSLPRREDLELFEAAEPGRLPCPVVPVVPVVPAARPWELVGRELAREGTGLGAPREGSLGESPSVISGGFLRVDLFLSMNIGSFICLFFVI